MAFFGQKDAADPSKGTYWKDGQRFAPTQAVDIPDYVANDPVLLQAWQQSHPEGGDQQVADSDKLNGARIAMIMAATAMPYNTGGPAFASAAPSAAAEYGPTIAQMTPDFVGPTAAQAGFTGGGVGGGAAAGGGGKGMMSSLLGGNEGWGDLALRAGSGIASEIQSARQRSQDIAQRNAELAQNQAQFAAKLAEEKRQFDAQQALTQGGRALDATQMDPFTQAKSRERQAFLAAMLGQGFQSGQGFKNILTPEILAQIGRFTTPDAMQANEAQFGANASVASGGKYVAPDMSKVGYSNRDKLVAALQGGQ